MRSNKSPRKELSKHIQSQPAAPCVELTGRYLVHTVWPICRCLGILSSIQGIPTDRKQLFSSSSQASEFVGFENFEFLFEQRRRARSLSAKHGTIQCWRSSSLASCCPVIVALVLNELRNKGMAKIYQTAPCFRPYFLVLGSRQLLPVFAFLNPGKGLF